MLHNYGFFDFVHSLSQYLENLISSLIPSILLKYVPLSALIFQVYNIDSFIIFIREVFQDIDTTLLK